jgi:hypothetical protein
MTSVSAKYGVLEWEPVLRDHLEMVTVQVHRVEHRAVVRQVDQDPVSLAREDGARRRERLAVQHVVERDIAQERRVLVVDPHNTVS